VRKQLSVRDGERFRVTATFERWGNKGQVRTVLLKDVRDATTGDLLADHLWFVAGKTWMTLGLAPGV
jgi:hypothetical protein